MSEEEKNAIEDFKLQIETDKEELPYSEESLKYKEIILNLIQKQQKELEKMKSLDIYKLVEDWETGQIIPVQKIKDIIDRIDYDIKKTKEIISKNTNIYATYRKNDYQIVRLRAMNTKSLDIKKRLQELLESEE